MQEKMEVMITYIFKGNLGGEYDERGSGQFQARIFR